MEETMTKNYLKIEICDGLMGFRILKSNKPRFAYCLDPVTGRLNLPFFNVIIQFYCNF